MTKQLALLVAGFVAAMVLAGQLARAAAGPEASDIEDSVPAWSSNGVDVAFQRVAAGQLPRVLDMTAGGRSVHAVGDGQLRGWIPGTEHVLVQVDGVHTLVFSDSGRFQQPYAEFLGTDAAASPDGAKVAYLRDGTLYVASADGTGERAVAKNIAPPSWDVTGPAWSPNGASIAIASGSSLLLVSADGSGSRALFSGTNQSVNPSWSADGTAVAFERDDGPHWEIWEVNADGAGARAVLSGPDANYRYPQFSPVSSALAYISDKQHAVGGATKYQYALYVAQTLQGRTTTHKLLDDVHPYSPPRWSPTAALIAVAAGRECRRWGIYVMRPEVGSTANRRSNLCRFSGTSGGDVIRGTNYFDLIQGLAGNDTIYGNGGNDRIEGNGGNDRIYGGAGNDVIFGGPGDDHIFGGPGNDVIVPGNGRDWIDCGSGHDTVEGAGPLDHIARNCEVVTR